MRAFAIVFFALLTTSAPLTTSAFADDSAMFAEQPGARGILYAAHDKQPGTPTLWLFGTIHVGKSDVTPFSHAVLSALHTTKRIALEADTSKMMEAVAGMVRLGRYPAGDTLDKHLPKKVSAELHALLAREHIPDSQIEPLKPWGVATMLELVPATHAHLDGNFAADSYLAAWAKSHDVPIVELEGFNFQLELMASIPEADQIEMLSDTVKEIGKPEATTQMLALYDGWSHGNEKVVLDEIEKDKNKSAAAARFQKKLLDDRNVGMADKAVQLHRLEGDSFIAVGSAHLLGKTGIVALLKQRGFDVVPVH